MARNHTENLLPGRIQQRMEAQKLTQAQLAAKAHVSPSAVSLILSGDRTPSAPILRRLAAALDTSMDYLLGVSEDAELEDLLQNSDVQSLFREFQSLSSNDKKRIRGMIELLKQTPSEGDKSK